MLAGVAMQSFRRHRLSAAESQGFYSGLTDERLMVEQELLKSPMLRNCSPGFVEELARSAKFRKLNAGPVRAADEAGSLASKFLMVLRGRVLASVAEQPVARLVPGKYFGETVLLGVEAETRAEYFAEVNSTIVEISREDFQEVLKEFESERRWFGNIYKRNSSIGCMELGTLVQPCQLFSGLGQDIIHRIDAIMVRRLYFPGELIVQEGQECAELFVLVLGRVGVEISGRSVRYESAGAASLEEGGEAQWHTGATAPDGSPTVRPRRLSNGLPGTAGLDIPVSFRPRRLSRGVSQAVGQPPPSCFGEVGMLGLQPKHSTSVVAKSVCHVRVLQMSLYQHTLREYSAEPWLQRQSSLSLMPRLPLKHIGTFREAHCHPEFLDFLESHLEMRLYAPKQRIMDEALADFCIDPQAKNQADQQEHCLYMMAHGSAVAMKGKREVGKLGAGDAFGEILGSPLPKCAGAAVLAEETCYVRVLHQGVIMRGLELFPKDRRGLLLKAQPRRLSWVGGTDSSLSPASMPRRISITDAEPGSEPLSPNADAIAAAELAKLRDPGMRGAIMQVLRGSSFFAGVSKEFVDEIASTSVDRIFMPGDRVIEEGQRGDSMFVMISGTAGIFVADPDICIDPQTKSQAMVQADGLSPMATKTRVGTLCPGDISGELAMLGVSPLRGATIQAETICSMWEISQDHGSTFLERFPESRLHFRQVIVQHLERTVMARIIHLPLLQGFSRKFLTLLGLYCEREAYFPGDTIVKEGQAGLKMYIINIGTAQLFLKGVTVKTYGAGGIYGASVMLGIHKAYFGSLVALQTCHVIRVLRSCYQHALEQYPAKQSAKRLRKAEEAAEEEFRGAMQRVSTRKLVWARYQGSLMQSVGNLSESELLSKTLESWKGLLRHIRECRSKKNSELERHTKAIREYVEKKKERLNRAQELALERDDCSWISHSSRSRSEPPPRAGSRAVDGAGGDAPSSCVDLPAIDHGRTTPGEELAKIVSDWAVPKPSPFYQLRVYSVLAKTMERPTIAGPLLPLLQASSSRRSETVAAIPEEEEARSSACSPDVLADKGKVSLPSI